MKTFDSRCRSSSFACLEWNDLERNAEHLSDLFREFPVVIQFVAGTSQTTAYDLFTKQLRHERSQSDDVGYCVAIPAFCKHPHAYDASDIAAGRVQGSLQFLC